MRGLAAFLVLLLSTVEIALAQSALTGEQINEAIALGKRGNVPIIRVGSFIGDFEASIAGPVARIAAAAAAATKDYKPFDSSNVTADMSALVYRVRLSRSEVWRAVAPKRIVLQAKGAKGLDGVIQPIREDYWEATFDKLPDGEFQVVVVTNDRPQKYTVRAKDRAKIQ